MPQQEQAKVPPVTLVGLRAEHVKKLHVVNMTPPATGPVRIIGPNESGKSSLLDAIDLLLRSNAIGCEMPIHRGEKAAEIVGNFGEFTVTRRFTEKSKSLVVTRGDHAVSKPQEFLDSLIGAGVAFDPFAFSTMKAKQQVNTLLQAVKVDRDPAEIDRERTKVFDERTAVNRKVKELKARIDAISVPTNTPDAELSADALNESLEQIRKDQQVYDNIRRKVDATRASVKLYQDTVSRLRQELAKAEADLLERELQADAAEAELRQTQIPSDENLRVRLQEVQQINVYVRSKQEKATLQAEYDALVEDADAKTAAIEMYEEQKRGLLDDVELPVEGLAIQEVNGEYQVTVHGVPLSQCSASQRLKLGMGIAMALNPTVRIILIRDASLLDEQSRSMVEAMALEKGYQAWLELVDHAAGDADGFVLCEGELQS